MGADPRALSEGPETSGIERHGVDRIPDAERTSTPTTFSVIFVGTFSATKHSGAVRATFSIRFPRLVNPAGVKLASVVVTLDFAKHDFTGAFTFAAGFGWTAAAGLLVVRRSALVPPRQA